MIRWMPDPGGHIKTGIENLRPNRPADETPTGRLTGIEHDTHQTYVEMYDLLTGTVRCINTTVYETQLHDLAGHLTDLHHAATRTHLHLEHGPTTTDNSGLIGIRNDTQPLSSGPSYDELAARRVTPVTPIRCTHSGCRTVLSVQHPLPEFTMIRCNAHEAVLAQ